uniref:Uncharacterized protein n=1 Tax=viral metagenome TaxID=1070528 RepID=A0A6C0HXX9_9ZZZZ
MENNSIITINNKKIFDFYNRNSNMDIETNNLLFIDLFESIFQQGSTINKSLSSQILNEITSLKTSMNSIHNNVSSLSSDLILKFLNIKKEYIEDMKTILATNTTNTYDKINTLIEKNNSNLIDKTSLLLTDIIPKNQETYNILIQDKLSQFYSMINMDTKQILSQSNSTTLNEFISNFDIKYSSMIHNIQSSSDERISKNISALKDISITNQLSQEKTFNELSEFLNKYRNSSFKGQLTENQLAFLLNKMFPVAEITDTSSIKASGDFIMKRENKDNILFENKDYEKNVSADEIKKFIRDCDTQNCHGIFLSQHCGIVTKSNYHIDIHKGLILVYVHNVEYTNTRIQIAIDIIDSLSNKLKELNINTQDDNTISAELIEDINNEYQKFISQKEMLYITLRDFQKKMNSQIEELTLPSLEKYLSPKFATANKKSHNCDICNNFSATTIKSLSAHKRACKNKSNIQIEIESELLHNVEIDTSSVQPEQSIPTTTKVSKSKKQVSNAV